MTLECPDTDDSQSVRRLGNEAQLWTHEVPTRTLGRRTLDVEPQKLL